MCIIKSFYLPNIILGELDSGSNIPIPSIVEVTPTEMSDISNIFGPSYMDIIEPTQNLDFQVPLNPKRTMNATNNSM